ncbi:MAG: hypothetical protein H7Z41_14530 [Cytophagales bacterium]|nr:hypothetical protein [Armatimonadota bacterium]
MSRTSFRFGVVAFASLHLSLIPLALAGCGGSGASGGDDNRAVTRVYTSNFDSGDNGWVAGFADLPADPGPSYELASDPNALLPESVRGGATRSTRGYRVVSHNRSDDVFSFLKRQVSGLVPETRYRAAFSLTFASDAPEGSAGIGGSPGDDVVVKAGAMVMEPNAVPQTGSPDFLRMNIDKGDQSTGGVNATVHGTVGIPGGNPIYTLKTLTTSPGRGVLVTADSAGRVWLMVGTDSGFEGRTDLYHTNITATLTPL